MKQYLILACIVIFVVGFAIRVFIDVTLPGKLIIILTLLAFILFSADHAHSIGYAREYAAKHGISYSQADKETAVEAAKDFQEQGDRAISNFFDRIINKLDELEASIDD